MTIAQAIAAADLTAPNDIEPETKMFWLSRVEGQLADLIYNTHEGTEREIPEFTRETDPETTELSAPYPYDELYVDYLVMRINLVHQEIQRYNNSAMVYAESLRRFQDFFNKQHMHKGVPALAF